MAAEGLAAIQLQLTSSQEQVATLSNAIDGVRKEASEAVHDLRNGLAMEQAKSAELAEALRQFQAGGGPRQGQLGHGREMRLVNTKEFAGGKVAGAKNESFKIWSKRVRIFCNSQQAGFKKILEDIELNEKLEINTRVLQEMQWEHAETANVKLADFLSTYCVDEALGVVEACQDQGFEAWRKLKVRYNPAGGRFELDRMTLLLSRKQCATLADLPAAIDKLERDLRNYEANTNLTFPSEWKIPLLLQLMPASHQKELQMKYTLGERDFAKMVANVTGFATEARILEGRGRKDMDLDNLQPQDPPPYTEQDWNDHWHDLQLQLAEFEDVDVSWLGKGGKKGAGKKGKGGGKKGKGWWPSKGTPWQPGKGGQAPAAAAPGAPGAAGRQESRICHWCQKAGHLKQECRSFLAGKPKVRAGTGAASLEEEDWQEDLGADGLDLGADSLDEIGLDDLDECEEFQTAGDQLIKHFIELQDILAINGDESGDCEECGAADCQCSESWTDEDWEEAPTQQTVFVSQFSQGVVGVPGACMRGLIWLNWLTKAVC